jgi:hypothetical protein
MKLSDFCPFNFAISKLNTLMSIFKVKVDENENGEQKIIRAHHDNGMPVPIERMNPVFQDLFVNDDGHVMFSPKYTADPNYGANYQYLVFKDGKQVALSKNLVFEIVENCPVTGHPVHEMVVPIELDEKIRDHQQKLVASNSSDDRRPQLHYKMEYKDGMVSCLQCCVRLRFRLRSGTGIGVEN